MTNSKAVKLNAHLTHREVDRILRSTRVFGRDGWAQLASVSLTVDMGAVEFVDFGAVGRLLLLLEGANRFGAGIALIPPASNLRAGEHNLVTGESAALSQEAMQREGRRIARAVVARRRVARFLSNLGFFDAAQLHFASNEAPLPVLARDDSIWTSEIGALLSEASTTELRAAAPLVEPDHPRDSPAILPWRWVGLQESEERGFWGERFVDFLHDHDLVMTRRDAESVVTTVLRELVDNVHEHAGILDKGCSRPPAALVGGLTLGKARYAVWRERDELYESDVPFNEWLAHRNSPLVRIFVGDSGSGIPATLRRAYQFQAKHGKTEASSARVILYSFQPAASRHADDRPRGLGLAAVGRFVRGYAGRVAIRSANAVAGQWCPKTIPEVFKSEGLAYSPGTAVEVTLGLTLTARASEEVAGRTREQAVSRSLVLVPTAIQFADNLSTAVEDRLRAALSQPIVVVLGSGWPSDRQGRTKFALQVRTVAKKVEGVAALVLVLPEASTVDVRTTFSVLDEVGETDRNRSRAWHLDEWTPPILVVCADGTPVWTGSSPEVRRLLYEALDGKSVDLEEAAAGLPLSPARDYLLVRREWFAVVGQKNARLRVTTGAIEEFIAQHVEKRLAARLDMRGATV